VDAKRKKVDEASDALNKEPSENNWKRFSAALGKSGIRYYRMAWANEGKLNKMQDLTKSAAELYDQRYKMIAKVPIFVRNGKRIRGATKYLVGLQVLNKV
jgi:hypothetical protein